MAQITVDLQKLLQPMIEQPTETTTLLPKTGTKVQRPGRRLDRRMLLSGLFERNRAVDVVETVETVETVVVVVVVVILLLLLKLGRHAARLHRPARIKLQ